MAKVLFSALQAKKRQEFVASRPLRITHASTLSDTQELLHPVPALDSRGGAKMTKSRLSIKIIESYQGRRPTPAQEPEGVAYEAEARRVSS